MTQLKVGAYNVTVSIRTPSVRITKRTVNVRATQVNHVVNVSLPPASAKVNPSPNQLNAKLVERNTVKILLSGPQGQTGQTGPTGSAREVFVTQDQNDPPAAPINSDPLFPYLVIQEQPDDCLQLYYWTP